MCLNQILFDEQIALIGYGAAGDPAEIRRHRRQLAVASQLMAPYPYPHRPYYPWSAPAPGAQRTRRRPILASPSQTGTR